MLPSFVSHPPFTLSDAEIVPYSGTMAHCSAGVYYKGRFVEQSMLVRTDRAKISFSRQAPQVAPTLQLHEHFVFGGYLFHHYGHFLLESLSRIGALRQGGGAPLLFFGKSLYSTRWQHDVLALLGCEARVYIPEEPVRVASLAMHQPECFVDCQISDRQLADLGVVEPDAAMSGKLWLSRARVQSGGLSNEGEIEAALAAHGWEVYHPEADGVEAQVRRLASADVVAGLDGSAFYTALLAKRLRGRVAIVSRRGFFPNLLRALFAKKKIPTTWICPKVTYLGGKGPEARFHAHDVQGVIAQLLQLGA